jgi:chemotaxis protein MotB
MTYSLKQGAVLLPLIAPVVLSACVSQSQYDSVVTQNQQLQQQVTAEQAHVARLQGAIKYTVNSDLLFPSGSWQMSADGKEIIQKMAKVLVPSQQDKLVVNGFTDNAPVGPGLIRAGVTSNDALSQKRAEAVMQYLVSQGVKPNMVSAQGHGEAQPVAPNTTPAGRSQNRRVEITLAGA